MARKNKRRSTPKPITPRDYLKVLRADMRSELERTRVVKGLTQRALAHRMDVSEAAVSKVLNGVANLSLPFYVKAHLAMGNRVLISGTPSSNLSRVAMRA